MFQIKIFYDKIYAHKIQSTKGFKKVMSVVIYYFFKITRSLLLSLESLLTISVRRFFVNSLKTIPRY